MHSTAGEAHHKNKKIVFSRVLYNRATIEQRRWLVKHETCHLICPDYETHGKLWRKAMVKAGEEPERCHSIPTTYPASCKCWSEHELTWQQVKQIKEGGTFTCPRCNESLKLDIDIDILFR
jgi:predicted SprT family Zn-dependent metalloprotease